MNRPVTEPSGDPDRPLARRIRAARAFSGKGRREIGNAVGLGSGQIGRYERGDWKETPKRAIREGIARVCGVPEWFLEVGFEGATRLADAPLPQPGGELGRRAQDAPPSPPDHGEDEHRQEPDAPTGSDE